MVMNNKRKTKMTKKKVLINSAISLAVAAAGVISVINSPLVQARTAEDIAKEIDALQLKINDANQKAEELKKSGDSIQAQLNIISSEKAAIEAEIRISKAQYEKLQLEIKQTEEDIKKGQKTLGETLAEMSIEESITPIERLAGSKNLSAALDNLEYQSSVKDALLKKVKEIKEKKSQLETKRDEVKQVLGDQEASEKKLQVKIAEQNKMLQETRGEEAEYQKYIQSQNAEKSKLQEEQARLILEQSRRNASSGGSRDLGTAGNEYSWGGGCVVDQYTYESNRIDPLGYGCGQCVSYTAWRLYKETGFQANWWGNANMWPAAARRNGFKVGTTPRAGSIAVMYVGVYGHVAWVESVSGGTMVISQYNWPTPSNGYRWGEYSRIEVPTSWFHEYIYVK